MLTISVGYSNLPQQKHRCRTTILISVYPKCQAIRCFPRWKYYGKKIFARKCTLISGGNIRVDKLWLIYLADVSYFDTRLSENIDVSINLSHYFWVILSFPIMVCPCLRHISPVMSFLVDSLLLSIMLSCLSLDIHLVSWYLVGIPDRSSSYMYFPLAVVAFVSIDFFS